MTLVSAPPPDEGRTFSDVLEQLGQGEAEKLSLREMIEAFGERGFGAVILMLALMALFPWPPGGKAVFSVPIILIAAELALQRDRVWLPRWLLKLSVSRAAYRTAVEKVLSRLRRVERLTRPRWPALTGEAADVGIGVICILLALMMALPVPFGDALPGLTLALFGLGIIQRDGAFILAGMFGTAVCGVYLALVWTTVVAVVSGVAHWAANLF
ncbi:exopolysaccharide biosynthesis protein [Brevundimonas diminuta]|uniref:Exopolysaccharide biosynthesis protein exod n=1 Tax=Brevundimonas naejangsanensis TaxID=588932 RepID=A0A172Y650_9CAUL|nr:MULTISPECIES: exopolysaccharide biosynthesis protein [Brevundimonas]ANF54678.1 exopolysaccharide biosynthesis protein exod [Brevundimonas naejangsanensis]MCO8029275.1 exopolysaccharide biosynthesis protein [Brevundimonas diminuta]